MDRRILCDSLIKWMKTFDLNRPINGVGDLSDGVLIAMCLKNIDVNHFNDVWLQKIRTDAGDNYRIKANNLKKILKNITDYYSEILGQSLVDFQMPDLNMIAETTDETELSRLLQLVLGCAVSSLQDYRAKLDVLREDNENLLKRNDDLMVLAGDARNFKDELDILRNKCEKMTKLESTIDAYKIKLEEMSDLRQQIKYLEETNLRLFDEKANLEQEYKQAKLLQTQVEFHKRTNQELYQKISELQRIADKAEFEKNRTEERLNAINAEKNNLTNQIELLRETNEKLSGVNLDEADGTTNSNDQLTGSLEDLNFLNLPADVR
ncbi:unnamed protein product [Rotaria sp. Silwood1]|nr:unnamed protein product [Rotaria sp. Silwood1]